MCGIAGIISNIKGGRTMRLTQMLESQKHRGPDFTGKSEGDTYSIGHNRLSIIDLSHVSNQPLVSHCGNYILSFNGEIYNYQELRKQIDYPFITSSDSEVLLAAYITWGISCLDKLNGMFSFAVYDIKKEILFGARDRFGVKPFYYHIFNEGFVFASEIKAILASRYVEKSWNNEVWANYLEFGYYPSDKLTFYKEIYQLEAGNYFIYNLKDKNYTQHQYYDFSKRVRKYSWENRNQQSIEEELKKELTSSIRLRLLADVKRGFNLSGGMDSTLLFSLIRNELSPADTKAFTFYCNDERYDEINWVKQIIKDSEFELEQCLLKSSDIPDYAEKIQYFQDEPYSGIATLAYAKIFESARSQGYKVILDGSGMDEQIGGYDYYYNNNDSIVQGVNSSPLRGNAINPDFRKLASKKEFPKPFTSNLQNLQFRDIFYTKLPRDLRMTDRISMAFSTEMREPFLNHNLVEKSFSLPDDFKYRNNRTKWIMREILLQYIGKAIAQAPKRPIQTPQREWLSSNLKEWVVEMTNVAIVKSNWLDRKEVRKELDNFLTRDHSNSFYIWQWVNIGLMLK